MSDFVKTYLAESISILKDLSVENIDALAEGLASVRAAGGRLFILGVGGSAGHAGHAVNDFRKICGFEAYAPTDNVSELTARVNDEGWDTCFGMAQGLPYRFQGRRSRLLRRGRQSRKERVRESGQGTRGRERSRRQGFRYCRERRWLHQDRLQRLRRYSHSVVRQDNPPHGRFLRRGLAPARQPSGFEDEGHQVGIGEVERISTFQFA